MKENLPSGESENISKYMSHPHQLTTIDTTVNHTTALVREFLESEDAPVFNRARILRPATKTQIQSLWEKKSIPRRALGAKWRAFAISWNDANLSAGYTIPLSILGLISALGGDKKISETASYVISLLEDTEFVKQKIATKSQIQSLWKKKIIQKENIDKKIWPDFARSWNIAHSTDDHILPLSFYGIIRALGGDTDLTISAPYIISLLEDTVFVEQKIATQIRALYQKGIITEEVVSKAEWTKFAKLWNITNPKAGYVLPSSFGGLFTALGGVWESLKIKSVISLLKETEFVEKEVTNELQIQSVWEKGFIWKKLDRKWLVFTES